MKEKLVLHICCAVCGSEIADFLSRGYEIILFFSNSNIYDREEYEKRKNSAKKLADRFKIRFFEDEYDRRGWKERTAGMETEPEGGSRCTACFEYRLRRAADFARKEGIGVITTTLSASPYKDEKLIMKIGNVVARDNNLIFLDPLKGRDKEEAWKEAHSISKKEGYYR
ncbi:MAG: epoxyqueuosine reductase QueH [Candidatus Colwellbacteria bacterium]|nr:epoxyqueuosine reductase QueH [Candidatus Colwellbacteria bacterium]